MSRRVDVVQRVSAGNPSSSWLKMMNSGSSNSQAADLSQFLASPSSSASSYPSSASPSSSSSSIITKPSRLFLPGDQNCSWHEQRQELPVSWSRFLLGESYSGHDMERCRSFAADFQPGRDDNSVWEKTDGLYDDSTYNYNISPACLKRESCIEVGFLPLSDVNHEEIYEQGYYGWNQAAEAAAVQNLSTTPSFKSCLTSTNSCCNVLDFASCDQAAATRKQHQQLERPSEIGSNPSANSGVKRSRVQASSLRARKEKLSDRITALHQLVSPFGKTDTSSVLLEAIGYIRFLQGQIEALSLPYLGKDSRSSRPWVDRKNDNRVLEDTCQDADGEPKNDLRSRGLCLVPLSFTLHAGSDSDADYCAATFGACF